MANNQLLASDSFVSGSLAAGWSVIPTNSFSQIAGPPFVAEPPNISVGGRQYWSGLTWPNDHVSEITINALTNENGTQAELWVRVQSGTYSGYLATIFNNSLNIFRADSGAFTQLGSTVTGLTVAAGDVWSMAAVGAVIIVYQNYKQVARWMDTAYASGSPGMGGSSSVNVTHSMVGSWRGYSAVQQDGVWTKQGILKGLAPLSGDIATGGGGIANATMLFEGNAQILSGTVFKLWFSAGSPAAESNIYYAESADGINWTRFGSAVISGQGSPFIIKNGSTYFLYTQPNGSNGLGNFSVYTSTNGTSWTVRATNILGALGGSGVWDGVVQWYFQPVANIAGTWYAVYSGANNSTTSFLKIGLATSPDGITWTKYVSNPVLTAANGAAVVNSCALALVNGIYYMWMFGVQPGRGGTPTLQNPGEGILYSTPDFKTWTLVRHSVHQSQLYEGVNFPQGQCYPNSIFTVGSQTFMFIQSSTNDGGAQSQYQLSLAIAPAPIPSLIQFSEDATSQVATDIFNRSAGGLGANWTTPTGGSPAAIVSANTVGASVLNTAAYAAYTASSFGNDQYSEITVKSLLNSSNDLNPAVRMSTSALTGYIANISGPINGAATLSIFKEVAGVFTQIGPSQTITPQVGDVLRLQVVGNVLSSFQNGFLVLQVQDVNNSITSGRPGFRISPDNASLANAQLSAWAGGNANVIPSYATAYSVPDCRVAPFGPNASRNVNGTLIYDVQTSSNPAIPPVDSRVSKPVASGTYPQNSRTPGTYGPGE